MLLYSSCLPFLSVEEDHSEVAVKTSKKLPKTPTLGHKNMFPDMSTVVLVPVYVIGKSKDLC